MRIVAFTLIPAMVLTVAAVDRVSAADMPAVRRAPVAIASYNWTGFYAGVNLPAH